MAAIDSIGPHLICLVAHDAAVGVHLRHLRASEQPQDRQGLTTATDNLPTKAVQGSADDASVDPRMQAGGQLL